MNILIVGCGRVGARLARILQQLGHEISVLDPDPSELERLDNFDGYTFCGTALAGIPIDTDTLRRAGIETCDAVVVVTSDDSVNIMVAQIAKEVFEATRVVCRITDPTLKEFFVREYGLKAICPTNLSTQSLLMGILENQESSTLTLGSTTTAFFMVEPNAAQIGRPLARVRAPKGELVFGLMHKNGTVSLAGLPSPTVEADDQLIFARVTD